MRRVLILGGGFGGVATAHTLREKLPAEDEIILVDRQPYFMVGFRKTWALLGQTSVNDGRRSLVSLEQQGIRFIQATISAIEPASRRALVDDQWIEADAMVIALGANLAPETIPGLQSRSIDVYDPVNIESSKRTLHEFRGGRTVIGIFGAPYKCPPAPYEIALQISEFFQKRDVAAKMTVFSPKPMSLPILGDAGCGIIESHLSSQGIDFLPSHKATSVADGIVHFENGEPLQFDLLISVPPHRCPEVIVDSGLVDVSGWAVADRHTLETTYPDVYAIGDCVKIPLPGGKQLPKAGIFAELQGKVVAQRITQKFSGQEQTAQYGGEGFCFLEFGQGKAAYVRGNFFALPGPSVVLTDASTKYLDEKRSFETDRLQAWFGG